MHYRLFDTHAHPQLTQFDADRDDIIRRALEAGIGMVCVGVDLPSSLAAIALAERYDGLYASVGLHPNDNLEEDYDNSAYLRLATNEKVVAIGEIGLDFYRTTEPGRRDAQHRRFESQLDLVLETAKPAIIHCRDAHEEMLSILSRGDYKGRVRGVIHSFTGTAQQAEHYVSLGLHIGLNGIVTFTRDYDPAVRNVPLDRIVLETDAPYLAPVPYRGTRNEPLYITETAKRISALRGESLGDIEKVTTNNALVMFGIDAY